MKAQINELRKKKIRDFNAVNIGPASDMIDPRQLGQIKSGIGSGAVNPFRGDITAAITNYRP